VHKRARKAAGMTQQQVATRLGEHQSFVSRYEPEERRLDVIEYLEVAKALSVRPTGRLGNFLRMLERTSSRLGAR